MKAGNKEYKTITDLPESLPVIIGTSIFILPGTYIPVFIEQKKYLELIEEVLKGNKLIGILQTDNTNSKPYELGCIARITSFSEEGNGKIIISLEGVCRFKRGKLLANKNNYDIYQITPITMDFIHEEKTVDILPFINSYIEKNELDNNINNKQILNDLKKTSFDILINSLCVNGNFAPQEQQLLLEAKTIENRAQLFLALSEKAIMSKPNKKTITLH